MYVLPPQTLPCNQVDLPDLRYIHADYAPLKYYFKSTFDIDSYNSMWLDKTTTLSHPSLNSICKDIIPFPVKSAIASPAKDESTYLHRVIPI